MLTELYGDSLACGRWSIRNRVRRGYVLVGLTLNQYSPPFTTPLRGVDLTIAYLLQRYAD